MDECGAEMISIRFFKKDLLKPQGQTFITNGWWLQHPEIKTIHELLVCGFNPSEKY